ncbi:MAG: hypothetical protein RLZZ262_1143 [Bacteroidota bacterium]|jgi:hypothetical protein
MITIGRREYVILSELSAMPIEAKVDTGAFRTAIHCIDCTEVETADGKILRAHFCFDGVHTIVHDFTTYHQRIVRSSFGESEMRYCVQMTIRIGGKKIKSQVTLTDRSDMRYHILLGRKTLYKKYLVDVSRIHVKKYSNQR